MGTRQAWSLAVLLLPPHLHQRVHHVLLHPGLQPLRVEVLVDHRVEEAVDLAEDAPPPPGGAGR